MWEESAIVDFTNEITREFGILSVVSGWTGEINFISWNGSELKFQIRNWTQDMKRWVSVFLFPRA